MSVTILSDVICGRPESEKSTTEENVYRFLSENFLSFLCIEHSPADTNEDCHEIEKYLDAVICKNLFLRNSAETKYFLLLMSPDTKFDSKIISKQIQSSRLSFASADKMIEILGVEPGSASIMCLINDSASDVSLLIDSRLLENEYFCCHPCKNTATLKFKTKDIFERFISITGHNYTIVNL